MKFKNRVLFRLKRGLRRLTNFFEGSVNDPLFGFGLAAIFLFSTACLSSGSLDSLSLKRDFSLASLSQALRESQKGDFLSEIAAKNSSESPEFFLIGNNSLKAAAPPSTFSPQVLGALVGDNVLDESRNSISEYIVEPGDTLSSIAAKFNVSLDTILWANQLNKNSLLKNGQKLVILPVSGILHHVNSGDTISKVADKYKGKMEEIIVFNNLSSEGDIYIGDIIIIPNGQMPKASYQYSPQAAPLANSYFIYPIAAPHRITQGLHWYNAVDFSNGNCGDVIYAAAAGEVLKVKLTNSTYRWAFNGYGNHLTVLHPNGVVTYYGHIAVSLVNAGDKVSQGQPIALMGGKPGTPGAGNSTGCHLHFGVSGANNPFAR